MPIVTLISDLGTKDYYAAAVKGAILTIAPETTLVDISHEIPPFDTFQAAFNVKNAFPNFPTGTIHLIGVDVASNEHAKHLAIKYRGHYFIGSDNGIFSLIFEEKPELIVEIQLGLNETGVAFPLREILAKAAGYIANGGNMEVLGPKSNSFTEKAMFKPVVTGNEIRGAVIYIDSFGNVFTNITKVEFEEIQRNRDYAIYFASANQPIRKVSTYYSDVPDGERLAMFSSTGYLQIAINKGVQGSGGGASQLFGLRLNHTIRIEFE